MAVCSTCGKPLDGNYFMVGDNFLQREYFEQDNNKFCSTECLLKFLMVMEVRDGDEENAAMYL